MLSAVVLAATFIPVKATAKSGPLVLNASGTIVIQEDDGTSTSTKTNIYTTTTLSFNEKYIYNLISNAVASTSNPNLTSAQLPADGYIVFDPTNGFANGTVAGQGIYYSGGLFYEEGLFYVTNKEGFFYPLNGFDETNGYYSFIELDNDDFGFYNYMYGEYSGSEPTKTAVGTYSETEASVLYIHDNPYAIDDADQPGVLYRNYNAIEIRSAMKASWLDNGDNNVLNNSDVSIGSGSGNARIDGNDESTVSSGHVTLH